MGEEDTKSAQEHGRGSYEFTAHGSDSKNNQNFREQTGSSKNICLQMITLFQYMCIILEVTCIFTLTCNQCMACWFSILETNVHCIYDTLNY